MHLSVTVACVCTVHEWPSLVSLCGHQVTATISRAYYSLICVSYLNTMLWVGQELVGGAQAHVTSVNSYTDSS
jgi:hypothetical protein